MSTFDFRVSLLNKKPEEIPTGKNPFVDYIVTTLVSSIKTYTVDEDGVLLPASYKLDSEPSVKIFTSSAKRKWLFSMSNKALSLYLWIIYKIEHGEDFLWINFKSYMEESGNSLNTVKAAIKELQEKGVVQYTGISNTFWINPKFMFRGNRVKKYESNTVEYSNLSKEDRKELRENLSL